MRDRIVLQLTGVLLFFFILAMSGYGSGCISDYQRDTYDIAGAFVLHIPLHILLALGTCLLRIDILLDVFRERNFRVRVSTLLIYGWPFAFFVIILPLALWVFSNETTAWFLMKHFSWFGSFSGQIESMLLGIGILAALEPKRGEPY